MLTLSCLMVDTVRIPTFKHAKKKLYLLVVGLFTVGAIALGFVTVIFYIFASYIIFALGKSIYCRTVQIINYIKLRYRLGAHYQDLRELFSHK